MAWGIWHWPSVSGFCLVIASSVQYYWKYPWAEHCCRGTTLWSSNLINESYCHLDEHYPAGLGCQDGSVTATLCVCPEPGAIIEWMKWDWCVWVPGGCRFPFSVQLHSWWCRCHQHLMSVWNNKWILLAFISVPWLRWFLAFRWSENKAVTAWVW